MAYVNPLMLALGNPNAEPEQPPAPKSGVSKGQMIMGILADALAGAAGQPGRFAQYLGQQKQQEQEDVRWNRRQQAERAEKQWEWQNKPKDLTPSEFERVLAASGVVPGTPQWAEAMGKRAQGMLAGHDPDVFVTLPNKQVYAGPKSGLATALMGGGAAPAAPVGKLRPINGGPPVAPVGGFPRPF